MLTTQQFERTRRLALTLAGIELADRHRELLERRSRRFGIHDTAGLDLLLDAAEQGEATATQRLLCLLTTKFTTFFRHPRHFELATRQALQAARQHGRARAWSTAASTGEEAYSMAMALIEAFGCDDPPVEILASDVDGEALALARSGEYGEVAARSLDSVRRERYLSEAGAARRWRLAPAVRRLVQFRVVNLAARTWSVEGPFDVIFCRNVLMYLEKCHRYAALEKMASLLASDGLLMLDPTEHLGEAKGLFVPAAEGVYARRPGVMEAASVPV